MTTQGGDVNEPDATNEADVATGDKEPAEYPTQTQLQSQVKKCIKGESSTANLTEDLTVASPVSNQFVDSRLVKRKRVESSKDEEVSAHVSEDANVFSDPSSIDSDADSDVDSDIMSDADSDVDSLTSPLESSDSRDLRSSAISPADMIGLVAAMAEHEEHKNLLDTCSQYEKSISDLKKEMAEMEEEMKYMKEQVSRVELELAQEKVKYEKLVEYMKVVVANQGAREHENVVGVIGKDDIDQSPKE